MQVCIFVCTLYTDTKVLDLSKPLLTLILCKPVLQHISCYSYTYVLWYWFVFVQKYAGDTHVRLFDVGVAGLDMLQTYCAGLVRQRRGCCSFAASRAWLQRAANLMRAGLTRS